MKKRHISFLTVILVISLLVVSGCAQPVKYVRIATASMGGAFYPMGNGLAQLITEKVPNIKSSAQSSGGSAENCRLLEKKDVELALIQSATLRQAVKGEGNFKDKPVTMMRAITATYFLPFHVLVRNDANVNTIADLKGKKVSLGPIASGIEINALLLLEAYGLTKEDIKAVHQNQDESYEALKTGSVDALIYATGAGSAQITDVMLSGKVKILSIDKDKIDTIIKKYPEFGPIAIQAKVYPGQEQVIETFAGSGVLVTRDDMDKKLIYDITKAIFTNLDFLIQRHNYFKETTTKDATVGIVVPLHPGAEQYLKEVGAIK